MKTVRVFLAHAKADSSAVIDAHASRLQKFLTDEAKGRAHVEIVAGRDDYDANFKRCGSWDEWAYDVATRQDYLTREPTYAAIFVTSWRVGGATAKIVEHSITAGKKVFILNGAAIVPIRSIEQVSPDFRSGWEVKP